ncbi:MAG: hypothetical protein JXR52_11375 [Bacteroidales bacterium]|nr:hypothetical protein [Bacteroidales bacterium]MBN2699414.1 hypothetical protein [Bacteroidales bacterium]
MKPIRILIFFAAVASVLLGISLLVPPDGIRLTNDLYLRFFNPSAFLAQDTIQYADLSGLVSLSEITSDPESFRHSEIRIVTDTAVPVLSAEPTGESPREGMPVREEVPATREHTPDRIHEAGKNARPTLPENKEVVRILNVDSLQQSVRPLELTDEGRHLLFGFFETVDRVRLGERDQVRILHYGDSQIESDRMTSLIRHRFQEVFGGYGCGLVAAVPLYAGNPAFTARPYGDFRRFTVFGKRDAAVNHNAYGVLGCYTALPRPEQGELPALEYRFIKDRQASRFDRVKLYLHSYAESGRIIFRVNDHRSDTLHLAKGGFSILNYTPDTLVKKLFLQFDLEQGGRLYGISFESERGIQMDNIAMRGSSGLVFTRMDPKLLGDMVADLGVGLLILQFGGNVVPYINNGRYYYDTFTREIEYLKQVFPGVPMIVVGPSDMSVRENGRYVTHPKLVPVRNALRQAAMDSGLIFWDLFEAMGGYNSMPSFVHSDPPLARPDYIHFSYGGANFMAEMFYNALMLEYGKYKEGERLQAARLSMASAGETIANRQSPIANRQSPIANRQSPIASSQCQSPMPIANRQ